MNAQPLAPPPNPYGASAPVAAAPLAAGRPAASGALISGASGTFAIRPGSEVHVGRDPAQCPVTLQEPRVSGVHATLKFENGQLFARDENSNNGTHVAGVRLPAGVWSPVPAGSQLKFGPVEFTVRLDV
jgi:predicted component of type VI protein secretion system